MSDGVAVQSAALGLAHEMGHAAQDLDKLLRTGIDVEDDNLNRYESPIAGQLGEPTRKNYNAHTGVIRMNNSIHYRTAHSYPWYQYWYWGKKYGVDHNALPLPPLTYFGNNGQIVGPPAPSKPGSIQ